MRCADCEQVCDADLVLGVGDPGQDPLLDTVLHRTAAGLPYHQGGALGLVLLGPFAAQAQLATRATLSLPGQAAHLLVQLLEELQLAAEAGVARGVAQPGCWRVESGYRGCGCRARAGEAGAVLELGRGQRVRVTESHSHEPGGRTGPGGAAVGKVAGWCEQRAALVVQLGRAGRADPAELLLGGWWLRALQTGAVDHSPLVNICPKPTSSRKGCKVCPSK